MRKHKRQVYAAIGVTLLILLVLVGLFWIINRDRVYTLEDFDCVIIGKTTKQELFFMAPWNSFVGFHHTGGMLVRYPTADGSWICIVFYNNSDVVNEIYLLDHQ